MVLVFHNGQSIQIPNREFFEHFIQVFRGRCKNDPGCCHIFHAHQIFDPLVKQDGSNIVY